MVIAIDGPGGVGKSTVSRELARRLQISYLDTGALYRAATLAVLMADVDPTDDAAVLGVVEAAQIDVTSRGVTLNGEQVSHAIRGPRVTAAVSTVSAHPAVRRLMVDQQRSWVVRHGGTAVVEGRDIGTVVFPEAVLKVFLTADAHVRAQRRASDEETQGLDVQEIAADLTRRDETDSKREASPLRQADDAVILDTTDLDAEGVVTEIVKLVGEVT